MNPNKSTALYLFIALIMFLGMVLVVVPEQSAQAATFTAGTFAELDAAITSANDEGMNPGVDTITLTADITYTADPTSVTSEIVIEGDGYTLDGADTYRHFDVPEAGSLTIQNLTLQNGNKSYGGSIQNRGTLLVMNCTFLNNTGADTSTAGGGAIFNHGKTSGQPTAVAEVMNSTFVGNSGGLGGAILNWQNGTSATVTVSYSTFSGSSSTYGGADIHSWTGTVNLGTSILADASSGSHCGFSSSGSLNDDGYNLVEDTSCGSIPAGTDPALGTLQDNGGPTWTQAIAEGSSALAVIPSGNNDCGTAITTDQRGEPRPSPTGGSCDIGAFELQVAGEPEISVEGNNLEIVDGDSTPDTADHTNFGQIAVAGGTITRTFTIKNPGTADLTLDGIPKVAISGAAAADFTVTSQPTSPVSASGETTFTVEFDPSEIGVRQAEISISNNDADENPYNFSILGTTDLFAGTTSEFIASISAANNGTYYPGTDTITQTADITLSAALPDITSTVVVEGAGFYLDGADSYRHFSVTSSGELTVQNLILQNGLHAFGNAGSIYNRGLLKVLNCTFNDNGDDTTLGGAIYNLSGSVEVTNSTFFGNTGDRGGAIYNREATSDAFVSIEYSTFANNYARNDGADIYTLFAETDLASSILANSLSGTHCDANGGTFTDSGYNLVEDASCGSIPAGTDPGLGALQDNGGPTPTMAIGLSSPALDQIPEGSSGCGTTTTTDQRGEARPSPISGSCDVGAFELVQLVPEINVTGKGQTISSGDNTPTAGDDTHFGALVCNGTEEHTFTIENVGAGELAITLPLTISGDHAADFTVTEMPDATVSAAGSTTFSVLFDPQASGARDATISIANDDPDENPYTFAVRGSYDGDNCAWVDVGSAGFSAGEAFYTSLVMDGSTPYIAYRDAGNADKATVMTYNGTDWDPVGSAAFSAGLADFISLAMDGSTPYVAYSDDANADKATVMSYNGATWENIGLAGFSAGAASYTSLALDGSTPYLAFQDWDNSLNATVMYYTGSTWEVVGSAGFSDGIADNISLAMDGSTPYIAYRDNANGDKLTVMTFNSSIWEPVGSMGFTSGTVEYVSLAIDGSTPYVAFRDGANANKLTVMRYVDSSWETVGSAGISDGEVQYTSLMLDGSTVYVGFRDLANSGATVMKYGITGWETLGSTAFSSGDVQYLSLALNDYQLYVAYRDVANSGGATVMRYVALPEMDVLGDGQSIANGDATPSTTDDTDFGDVLSCTGTAKHTFTIENTGSSSLTLTLPVEITGPHAHNFDVIEAPNASVGPGSSTTFTIKFDPSATGLRQADVSITNDDPDESPYTFAIEGTGSSGECEWIEVGEIAFSPGEADYLSFAMDGSTPYVAFQDLANAGKATVMKYDGSGWVTVGDAGFTPSTAEHVSLALDGSVPYVAFSDGDDGGRVSVMKYNGSSWGYVGYKGFSAGDAAYVSLVLNGSTPVVAYQDIANSNEPAVMYYRSFFNDWNEATKYFAYAGASQIAGTIFDGDPLFAYEDWGVNKASAMEYSGGNMLDAGSRGFSPGETSYNSLAANESTAYLAFRDADSSYKATVMTYDGSAWSLFGSSGISGGVANYTSIALDDLTPYLAYVDGFYSNEATVRKHNGLGWEYVGTGGFTPGNVDQTNLAMDEYTPYIAFIDVDNGSGVTVMKYVPKTYQLFLPLIVR